jgi:hypothetical protein
MCVMKRISITAVPSLLFLALMMLPSMGSVIADSAPRSTGEQYTYVVFSPAEDPGNWVLNVPRYTISVSEHAAGAYDVLAGVQMCAPEDAYICFRIGRGSGSWGFAIPRNWDRTVKHWAYGGSEYQIVGTLGGQSLLGVHVEGSVVIETDVIDPKWGGKTQFVYSPTHGILAMIERRKQSAPLQASTVYILEGEEGIGRIR